MCCVRVHEHMPLLKRSVWLTGPTPPLSGTGGTLGHSMAWTPTVATEQPSAHLCVSLELWKTGGALIKLALSSDHAQKWMLFYLFSHYKLKTLQKPWNSPSKDGMQGERSQTRQDREAKSWKRHYRESIRERWREMGGGRSLYFSAPFGSFIPQRLGFIGGSFNNKGSAFEMKSSCVCVGEPPFLF